MKQRGPNEIDRNNAPAVNGPSWCLPAGLRATLWASLSVFVLWPLLTHAYQLGFWHDWSYFTLHSEATRQTFVEHAQFPQWNPWYCGGIPAIGNVQSDAGSPFQVFNLLFGSFVGPRLTFIALLIIGMEGAYRYARALGTRELGALTSAVIFGCSGRVVQIFIDGHLPFVGFLILPWLALAMERGSCSTAWAVGGGLLMSLVFMHGGAVSTPMIAVFLAVQLVVTTTREALRTRSVRETLAPLRSLVIMASTMVGVSALRLLPFIETLLKYPRVTETRESYSVEDVFEMLAARTVDGGTHGLGTAYVGVIALSLAGVGVLCALVFFARAGRDRDRAVYVGPVVLVALLVLMWDMTMGYGGPLHTFDLVRSLPVLENIRNPYRYTFMVTFLIGQLAGVALSSVEGAAQQAQARWVRPLVVALCAALSVGVLVELVPFEQSRLAERHQPINVPVVVHGDEFRQAMGNRWRSHAWPLMNRGTLSCFEEQAFPQSRLLRGDLAQEEYFAEEVNGTVTRTSWSPHRIALVVELAEPARLYVNQNYARGWRSDVGTARSEEGLLVVDLPPGVYSVTLRFRDVLVGVGAGISALSWLLLALWYLRARRQRARSALARDPDQIDERDKEVMWADL